MIIDYKNINICQGDDQVLRNVNICVEEGEMVYYYIGGITGRVCSDGSIDKCLSGGNSLWGGFENSSNQKAALKDQICPEVDGSMSNCYVDEKYLPSTFSTDIWDNSVNPPVIKNTWKYSD